MTKKIISHLCVMKDKSSKYTGVYFRDDPKYVAKPWRMQYGRNGVRIIQSYATERLAAIAYDMRLIRDYFEPVNILKRA
jgi:hypothetical protein